MKQFLSAFILLAFAGPGFASEPHEKPNIVVILSDDYGWGSAGCYGGPGISFVPGYNAAKAVLEDR